MGGVSQTAQRGQQSPKLTLFGPENSADEIKSGKWEFTTQMQLPGAVQCAPSGQAAGGNAPMTRIAC